MNKKIKPHEKALLARAHPAETEFSAFARPAIPLPQMGWGYHSALNAETLRMRS